MEQTIRFSLNQVNFESYDLGDDQSSDEPLDSFSNIVCFDSDFPSTENDGLPIAAKKITLTPVSNSQHNNNSVSFNSLDDSEVDDSFQLYGYSSDPHYVSNLPVLKPGMDVEARSSVDNSYPSAGLHYPDGKESHTGSSGTEPTDRDASETFKAFTETVEALALQKSVIGSHSVMPASADEIAKAIAAAQAKMKQSSSSATKSLAGGHHKVVIGSDAVLNQLGRVENGTAADQNRAVSDHSPCHSRSFQIGSVNDGQVFETSRDHFETTDGKVSGTESGNRKSHEISRSDHDLGAKDHVTGEQGSEMIDKDHGDTGKDHKQVRPESHSSNELQTAVNSQTSARVERTPTHGENILSGSKLDSVTLGSRSTETSSDEGRKLIRIAADSVLTESTPRSSWFWSKKSPQESGSTKKTKAALARKNLQKSTGNSNCHREPEMERDTLWDRKSNIAASSGYVNIDYFRNEGRHDLVNYAAGKSSIEHGALTNDSGHRNKSSVNDSSNYVERNPTEFTTSPLSYAFVLPETSIPPWNFPESPAYTQGYSMAAANTNNNSSGSVVPWATENSSSPQSLSRQSSTVEAVGRDDGRLERLMREKAGLEGRLEVLERENHEMLRQQADLKLRAAAAEQQMQVSAQTSSTASTVVTLTADVENLRQTRARLESVVLDAHRLLADKDAEIRTLERDLEMARLAGERHLERVEDLRREATSRDVTVRDLKAKVTELYVQSQTAEQSQRLTEGELASVRADIAALVEAKEWYAGQLRATQKDRTRLQTETAAARADTISAGVAAERLRAENARLKRNLSEMEQRVLAEKRTLARHLEDIESDMLEREASHTAQLQQATESVKQQQPTEALSRSEEAEELEATRSELKRAKESAELLRRENVDFSRRLALAQQWVVDRDATIKSLENDREAAELRAETAEQNAALSAADVQRLDLQRAELQVQVESAAKEKNVFDKSLQALKHDTVLLETNFRRMQAELASKSAEVEKLTALRNTIGRGSENLSELWPDPETAAGLRGSKETQEDGENSITVDSKKTAIPAVKTIIDNAVVTPTKCSVEIQTDVTEIQGSLNREIFIESTESPHVVRADVLTNAGSAASEMVCLSDKLDEIATVHQRPGKMEVVVVQEHRKEELVELKEKLSRTEAELHLVRGELEKSSAEQLRLKELLVTSGEKELNTVEQVDKSRIEMEMAEKCHKIEELQKKLLKSEEDLSASLRQLDNYAEQFQQLEQEKLSIKSSQEASVGKSHLEVMLADKSHELEVLEERLLKSEDDYNSVRLELDSYSRQQSKVTDIKILATSEVSESSRPLIQNEDKMRLELDIEEKSPELENMREKLQESEEQLASIRLQLDDFKEQFRRLEAEKLAACLDRAAAVERTELLSAEMQRILEERSALEARIEDRDAELIELRGMGNELAEVHGSKVSSLVSENSQLQMKLSDIQRDSHKQISKLKSKVLKLTKELEASSIAHKEQITDFESRFDELMAKMTTANDANDKLTTDLNVANETNERLHREVEETQKRTLLDADERTTTLQNHLQTVLIDLEASNTTRHRLQLELDSANNDRQALSADYSRQVTELQVEIDVLRTGLANQKTIEEHAASLALQLEKERGRLAGLQQSHEALKTHAETLEAALASHTTTRLQHDTDTRTQLERRDVQLAELTQRFGQLETTLNKERQMVKDLRAQLMTEKGNHIKVRRQLEQVTAEHTQLATDTQQLRDTLANMTVDMEAMSAREAELKMMAERSAAELRVAGLDRDRLDRELDDQKARDMALQDNIQGLEWRLNEKDSEISAAQQKLQLVEDRQNTELMSITNTLQSTNSELTAVRDELSVVKKEKSDLQLKMTQLRMALQSALHTKVNLSVATETTAELERLLRDSAPASVSTKPLSFLQATLSGLRGEITSLLTQINEHTTAVQSSSLSWRELEAQVHDLREVCKSSAADRAADRTATAIKSSSGSHLSSPVPATSLSPESLTVEKMT